MLGVQLLELLLFIKETEESKWHFKGEPVTSKREQNQKNGKFQKGNILFVGYVLLFNLNSTAARLWGQADAGLFLWQQWHVLFEVSTAFLCWDKNSQTSAD